MYYSTSNYPAMPQVQPYCLPVWGPPLYRTYPPVDISIFQGSIHSFHRLMEQGSILLTHLADPSFSRRIMAAAQQGKQAEVDTLMKSIGLKVPISTRYTPSGVEFTLSAQTAAASPNDCCSLSISLKWGR
ncbi:hypothetical protein [Neobacillus muris]|uniref:hypothetical protein n=1 Tax=Neobacillus muris TaxID=2941334 RepID=UPI00203D631D|nr:hypothetical protein [Neobacillus muris]